MGLACRVRATLFRAPAVGALCLQVARLGMLIAGARGRCGAGAAGAARLWFGPCVLPEALR